MTPLLRELSESKLFPSIRTVNDMDTKEIAELLHLYIVALRILATEDETDEFAKTYVRRARMFDGHDQWRQSANDLYALLYAMKSRAHDDKKHLYSVNFDLIDVWLKSIERGHIDEGTTHRLFARIDFDLKIKDDSLKSIRRIVTLWPDASDTQRELAMTRLLQKFKARAWRSELLPKLKDVADKEDLELKNVKNPDKNIKEDAAPKSFLAFLQNRKKEKV